MPHFHGHHAGTHGLHPELLSDGGCRSPTVGAPTVPPIPEAVGDPDQIGLVYGVTKELRRLRLRESSPGYHRLNSNPPGVPQQVRGKYVCRGVHRHHVVRVLLDLLDDRLRRTVAAGREDSDEDERPDHDGLGQEDDDAFEELRDADHDTFSRRSVGGPANFSYITIHFFSFLSRLNRLKICK